MTEKEIAESMRSKFDCDAFAAVPGKLVYAVVVQNMYCAGAEHIVYIGSTSNLQHRLRAEGHPLGICRERFQSFNRNVCCKYFYSEENTKDEKFLIGQLRPILNTIHKPRIKGL